MNRVPRLAIGAAANLLLACGPVPHESKDFRADVEELSAEACADRVSGVSEDTTLAVVDVWGNDGTSGVEILDDYADEPQGLRVFVFYPGAMQEAEGHGSSFTFPTPGEEVTLSATYDCDTWQRIANREGATNYGDYNGQEDLGRGVVDYPFQP